MLVSSSCHWVQRDFPRRIRSSSTSVGTWPRGSQVVRILIPGEDPRCDGIVLMLESWTLHGDGIVRPLGVLDTYTRGLSYWDSGLL